MGWQIMGTDHLKPRDTTLLSDEEMAEAAIDFIENAGYALAPWQATTLRAMLTYPVGTRFVVNTPRQHAVRSALPAPHSGCRNSVECGGTSHYRDCPRHGTGPEDDALVRAGWIKRFDSVAEQWVWVQP